MDLPTRSHKDKASLAWDKRSRVEMAYAVEELRVATKGGAIAVAKLHSVPVVEVYQRKRRRGFGHSIERWCRKQQQLRVSTMVGKRGRAEDRGWWWSRCLGSRRTPPACSCTGLTPVASLTAPHTTPRHCTTLLPPNPNEHYKVNHLPICTKSMSTGLRDENFDYR